MDMDMDMGHGHGHGPHVWPAHHGHPGALRRTSASTRLMLLTGVTNARVPYATTTRNLRAELLAVGVRQQRLLGGQAIPKADHLERARRCSLAVRHAWSEWPSWWSHSWPPEAHESCIWRLEAAPSPCDLRSGNSRRAPRIMRGSHLLRPRAAPACGRAASTQWHGRLMCGLLIAAAAQVDTLSYNSHTTGADALWAGLPLLTLSGRYLASRVGASLGNSAGVPHAQVASLACRRCRRASSRRRPTRRRSCGPPTRLEPSRSLATRRAAAAAAAAAAADG